MSNAVIDPGVMAEINRMIGVSVENTEEGGKLKIPLTAIVAVALGLDPKSKEDQQKLKDVEWLLEDIHIIYDPESASFAERIMTARMVAMQRVNVALAQVLLYKELRKPEKERNHDLMKTLATIPEKSWRFTVGDPNVRVRGTRAPTARPEHSNVGHMPKKGR